MIKMQYWSFLYLGTTEWNVRSISEGNNFGKKCVILYKSNKSFFPQLTFSHLGIIKNRKWLVDEYNIYSQNYMVDDLNWLIYTLFILAIVTLGTSYIIFLKLQRV